MNLGKKIMSLSEFEERKEYIRVGNGIRNVVRYIGVEPPVLKSDRHFAYHPSLGAKSVSYYEIRNILSEAEEL